MRSHPMSDPGFRHRHPVPARELSLKGHPGYGDDFAAWVLNRQEKTGEDLHTAIAGTYAHWFHLSRVEVTS